MYTGVFYNRQSNQVYVWDDVNGLKTYPYSKFRYAYREKAGGDFKSIYGHELEKI
jgi:hypothetical protein